MFLSGLNCYLSGWCVVGWADHIGIGLISVHLGFELDFSEQVRSKEQVDKSIEK